MKYYPAHPTTCLAYGFCTGRATGNRVAQESPKSARSLPEKTILRLYTYNGPTLVGPSPAVWRPTINRVDSDLIVTITGAFSIPTKRRVRKTTVQYIFNNCNDDGYARAFFFSFLRPFFIYVVRAGRIMRRTKALRDLRIIVTRRIKY